jgi:hypothetical protein
MMLDSVEKREKKIGEREHAFDLQRQIYLEAERSLAHLNRQLQADPSQRIRTEQRIFAMEIQRNEALERFENAANELREAYPWRGGTVPVVDTRTHLVNEIRGSEDESELSRQFGMEAALRKVQEDAIPYSTKLAVTTAFAVEQIFKKQPETVVAEPSTLLEKIVACEAEINRLRLELDYADQQLRPVRLAKSSSRLGELRAMESPEIRFAEEEFATKQKTLSELIRRHKDLLAESQRVHGTSMGRRLPEKNPLSDLAPISASRSA